jgi:hypothetical protein
MQRVKKTVISDGNSYLLSRLYAVQQQYVTRIQTPVTWIGLKALCSALLNGESQNPQLKFSEIWCYRTQFKWVVHKRSPDRLAGTFRWSEDPQCSLASTFPPRRSRLLKNRFLQACVGAKNTKEKSRQCFTYNFGLVSESVKLYKDISFV